MLIALPDIFRGIDINPLGPGNTTYLLWMIMGFLVVTAVLVVGFGRLGDMYGRVRMYNLGFVIFTVASILPAVTWQTGDVAALWLIGWRVVRGVGTRCTACPLAATPRWQQPRTPLPHVVQRHLARRAEVDPHRRAPTAQAVLVAAVPVIEALAAG